MSGFHVLPPSWTSGATCTSNSDESADVSASSLLSVQRSRKWRSAGLGTLRLTLDAGVAKQWDTVVILGHNGFSGTAQVFAATTVGNLFTSPSYTGTAKPLRFPGDLSAFTQYDTWLYEGAVRTHQYIGIQIIDNTNPDGYFQAGVVMIGVKFEPRLGPELGAKTSREDTSSMIRLLNGEGIVRPKRGNDEGNWTFPKQTPSETIRWREINRVYGQKIPMVYKWDPIPAQGDGSYQQHTFYYGYAQWNQGAITSATGSGTNDVELGIIEL